MLLKYFRKTPLAWHQLVKQKTRLLVALAGIAFADVLMFIQMGLLDSLYDSATKPHQEMDVDLVLLDPRAKTLINLPSFPRKRLYQALGYDGVASAMPLSIGMASWRNPETHINHDILLWGIDPERSPFSNIQDVERVQSLKLLNRVLFDRASSSKFGPIAQRFQEQGTAITEVSDQRMKVTGLFAMGVSFGAEGNAIASLSTFLTLLPNRQANRVDIGLLTLEPGADLEQVQGQLQVGLPPDVKVVTKAEFIQLEKVYCSEGGTGFIFNLGAVVGFVVGTVIVYQILYTDVSDHLPEYATLKAMGYSDSYLDGVLVQEVLVLAVFGFIPGFFFSVGLYQLTANVTALPVVMKTGRAIIVLMLTLVMCAGSGLIALRKLRSADPADIFG
ncbi:ABC transporter permease DevC [Roseofilum reptotaenium CS-1145]|uniref:ABC transporter n=1 Tax=Roseofilum reptotaenium AO1-A TaxID=1925591 RepID=A0A1L9QKH5_9CYAN|nr:ABC transporter permease DevC [Roseofilum reptotaenium]MDB9516284.1 ABC transporter permease DevC [Roseofilum reptotaenium CS-1145]OJJ16234.1 ABC transporter [Roseofilum reptotaenium AO1-A]